MSKKKIGTPPIKKISKRGFKGDDIPGIDPVRDTIGFSPGKGTAWRLTDLCSEERWEEIFGKNKKKPKKKTSK